MMEIKYQLMEHHAEHHTEHKEGGHEAHKDSEHAAHHDTRKEGDEKKLKSKKMFVFPLIVFAILAGIFIGYLLFGASGNSSAAAITQEQASAKAASYINSVLQGNVTAKILSINESSGLYNLQIDVGGQPYDSFMTKDGKMLFPSGINLEHPPQQAAAGAGTASQAAIPKSDKPKVELFVMSLCPYGVQAEEIMKPVADLLGSRADIKVRFIAQAGDSINSTQSLHGSNETKQDLRQICIMKNYPDKYWNYLSAFDSNCYPDWYASQNASALESCWKSTETAQGIDSAKIDSCVNSESLAMLKSDEQAAGAYGVSGSPTLMINGATYNGARTSDGYKSAICSAFNNPPAECSQNVGTASQAAGAAPASAAAACG